MCPDRDDFVDKSADQLVGSLSSCACLCGNQMKRYQNLVSFALVLCPCFENDNAIKGVVEPRDPTVKISSRSEVKTNFRLILQTASAHCSNAASPKQLCVDIFTGSSQKKHLLLEKLRYAFLVVGFIACWIRLTDPCKSVANSNAAFNFQRIHVTTLSAHLTD